MRSVFFVRADALPGTGLVVVGDLLAKPKPRPAPLGLPIGEPTPLFETAVPGLGMPPVALALGLAAPALGLAAPLAQVLMVRLGAPDRGLPGLGTPTPVLQTPEAALGILPVLGLLAPVLEPPRIALGIADALGLPAPILVTPGPALGIATPVL